jgi:uncharacterized membrane protein YfcA
MSRFPAALLLLFGLALLATGMVMMFSFVAGPSPSLDPSRLQNAEALRQGASARVILGTYLFAIAFGLGIFSAGLGVLCGRWRDG